MTKRTIITCMFLFVLGCSGRKEDATTPGDSPLMRIKLKDLAGNDIDLTQYKDKAIFINFWATWCAPCVAEMPSIQRAQNTLAGKNIEFIFASNEPVDRITTFMERKKLDLQFVQSLNQEELLIQVLPTTYIINPAGELVFSEAGSREWDSPENIEMLTKIIDDHE